MDPDKLANIFGAETIKEVYKDGLSEPTREVGKALTDVIKGLRLFTAPIQLLGAYQDRLVKFLEKVREGVPDENQIPAPPEIAGPIIENLRYIQESSFLEGLYLNLLKRSIDKERVNEAHPAFVKIIEQLSRDEAYLLHQIKKQDSIVVSSELKPGKHGFGEFADRLFLGSSFDINELYYPEHFRLYINHLQVLNLVVKNEDISDPMPSGKWLSKSMIVSTDFGALFINACVPDNVK